MGQHPSLLGLARELRLLIYGYVSHLDLDAQVVDRVDDGWGTGGFWTHHVYTTNAKLNIDWVTLTQTCRAIHTEVREFVAKASGPENEGVWEMDLHVKEGGLEHLVWRRISCPPDATRLLIANIEIDDDRGLHLIGHGGPAPVTRALYRTLSLLVHCGPWLDPKRPLSGHMHVRKLLININCRSDGAEHRSKMPGGASAAERLAAKSSPRIGPFEEVCMVVLWVRNVGILCGYIDQIQVAHRQQVRIFEIERKEKAVVPPQWHRYGFDDWGVA